MPMFHVSSDQDQQKVFTHHLKTDNTATNDDHLLRNLSQCQSTRARDDSLLVNLKAGERRGFRTSGDENVLAAKRALATLVQVDLDFMLVDERTSTLDVVDAVLLNEVLNTLCEALNRGVLGLHHLRQVELDFANIDTALLGVVKDLVVEVGVVEERF